MMVPKAAVDKNDRLQLRKHDVGATRKSVNMQSEPKSVAMQKRTHHPLGARVLATDSAHHPTALFAVKDVGQC